MGTALKYYQLSLQFTAYLFGEKFSSSSNCEQMHAGIAFNRIFSALSLPTTKIKMVLCIA